jgi:hypothetical protein
MSLLSKVFDKSGGIIDAIKKLIDDDTSDFSKTLGRAGGVIALIRVGRC